MPCGGPAKISKLRLSGGTSVPACTNVMRAGDGNRTRTISLGIRPIVAPDRPDLGIRCTARDRDGPCDTGANGPRGCAGAVARTHPHDARRRTRCPHPAADLSEVARIYGIRHWTEQGYNQVKDELGWADFRQRPAPAALINLVTAGCGLHHCIPD